MTLKCDVLTALKRAQINSMPPVSKAGVSDVLPTLMHNLCETIILNCMYGSMTYSAEIWFSGMPPVNLMTCSLAQKSMYNGC